MTDEELATIKAMNATAALVFHIGGNDWTNAQSAALKQQFEKMGIKVIAETDAGFNAASIVHRRAGDVPEHGAKVRAADLAAQIEVEVAVV